jgi:hypothetical protein
MGCVVDQPEGRHQAQGLQRAEGGKVMTGPTPPKGLHLEFSTVEQARYFYLLRRRGWCHAAAAEQAEVCMRWDW